MDAIRRVADSRLLVAVVGVVVGSVATLVVLRAGDWRDVALVAVGGALTLVAGELAGAREFMRQRSLQEDDRRSAEEIRKREALDKLEEAAIDDTHDVVGLQLEQLFAFAVGDARRFQSIDEVLARPDGYRALDMGLLSHGAMREFMTLVPKIHDRGFGNSKAWEYLGEISQLRVVVDEELRQQRQRLALREDLLRPDIANREEMAATIAAIEAGNAAMRGVVDKAWGAGQEGSS